MAERAAKIISLRVKGLPPARERLRDFLRAEYPEHTVSRVQQRLADVGHPAAEYLVKSWVSGAAFPNRDYHLDALLAAFGKPLAVSLWGELILANEDLEQIKIEQQRLDLERKETALASARANRRKYLGIA